MGWIQNSVQKLVGTYELGDKIKQEVRNQMNLAEIESLITSEDDLLNYYQQLNQV
jgi:predicted transcriptional regulator